MTFRMNTWCSNQGQGMPQATEVAELRPETGHLLWSMHAHRAFNVAKQLVDARSNSASVPLIRSIPWE